MNLKITSLTYHLNYENALLTFVYVITLYQLKRGDGIISIVIYKNVHATSVGDEFHYAFECPALDLERSLIVPFIYKDKNK